MNKSIFKRLLCGFLTVLMLAGSMTTGVFAAGTANGSDATEDTTTSLDEIKAILDTVSYSDYIASQKGAEKAKDGFEVILADAYVSSLGTDGAEDGGKVVLKDAAATKEAYGKEVKSVYLPEKGSAVFKINVPSTGLYTFDIEYYSVEAKATSIERMLYLDGKIPFSEARYLEMPKTWIDVRQEDGSFKSDLTGNDIRPSKAQLPAWNTYTFKDSTGFVVNPLQLYLTAGEHTITFEAVREPVVFTTMKFYPY